ncbi:hypothetical protein EDE12_12032 [Methylosinus sp. sav-2]|nr:hypothetical protein EDE12_12032 [Methylosinus sp. sav-2]
MVMTRILAIHPGTAYHCEALEAPRYARLFDALVRPEELGDIDLSRFDIVLAPCRTPASRLAPHRARLEAYLAAAGAVVAMGETDQHLWLPSIRFTSVPTNWWWWLEPGASLGLSIADPRHPLFARIGANDIAWHLHGVFAPPDGARSLIGDAEGRSVLYLDEVTTKGRMLVTSLDPFYHHGSHFMPAATRFLDGFLPWLKEEF